MRTLAGWAIAMILAFVVSAYLPSDRLTQSTVFYLASAGYCVAWLWHSSRGRE